MKLYSYGTWTKVTYLTKEELEKKHFKGVLLIPFYAMFANLFWEDHPTLHLKLFRKPLPERRVCNVEYIKNGMANTESWKIFFLGIVPIVIIILPFVVPAKIKEWDNDLFNKIKDNCV